jgi:molybdopterin-containing oxidoreductase family iron-sulfur binding subunit
MKRHLPVWRSLDEKPALPDEFPEHAIELDGMSRRSFVQLMGASLALAGVSGCRRPAETILPYGKAPEELVPGRPQRYATAMPLAGTAFGVVVESHEGRPTKIEGNPLHPDSRGGASAFVQASILGLYDPDRSRHPTERGRARSWDEAFAALKAAATTLPADGRGLAILTEAHRSPTLLAGLAAVEKRWPAARIVRYEAFDRLHAREGSRLAFGRPLEPAYELGKARVIVTLDCDLLHAEGSSVKHARAFADGRSGAMNRLYAIESAFTVTGTNADHRLRTKSARIQALAAALAHAVGIDVAAPALTSEEQRYISAVAADLRANRGAGAVVAGETQPPAVHALAHLINHALETTAVTYRAPLASHASGPAAIVELAGAMTKGDVQLLVMLGGNPVYDAPADARFAEAITHVPTSVHLAERPDETSAAATWHLGRAHYLEAWSDVRAEDGTLSIVQPLIAPLHGGRTDAEVVERLLDGTRTPYQLVTSTWKELLGLDFTRRFRRALHDGVLAGSALPAEAVKPIPAAFAPPALSNDLEVTFRIDSHAYDGRFANNGWLQELPDPLTKLTWDNVALISPATATRLGLRDGDLVTLRTAQGSGRLPVLRAPGQADDSLAVTIGLGRKRAGAVGTDVGFDVTSLRSSQAFGHAMVTLERSGLRHSLGITQEHHSMEGRPLVRQATRDEYAADPGFARKEEEHPPLLPLWKEHQYEGHKWGMAIDLNRCIGCNACMVACQAENNIPLVGKVGVEKSREMHWIRVDRYFVGDENDPEAVMQPVACQQCENAPCEQVCPVGATTHSPEGLNDMAYNRCVGTRYCANNCPYKVRRFNFFNYNKDVAELRRMQFNPDVTVRSRGVMEKCTYCVQRINQAKIAAHGEGRDRVRDGEIVTACQQTCPAQAIVFGDLNDPKSEIAQRNADSRNYVLLEELAIKPRTSYLARIRNPNPELG